MDFATTASQNGVGIIKQMYHILILFDYHFMIEDESNKKCYVFCHFVKDIDPYKGTAYKYKISFVMQPLQSTVT
jgi:hypothetical protein